MTGPDRIKLRPRRKSITQKAEIKVGDTPFGFYVDVGYDASGPNANKPLELFLRIRGAVRGSPLGMYADSAGESLSLLLQHGHTFAQLHGRYKPGSLERGALEVALVVSIDEGLEIDAASLQLADELAEKHKALLVGAAEATP